MLPTDERLHADDLAGRELYLRLVVKNELILVQRTAEIVYLRPSRCFRKAMEGCRPTWMGRATMDGFF
jgi:hypothetical protein